MKSTASPSGRPSSGRYRWIASTALRSRSSAVDGRIPAAKRSSSDSTVSSMLAYAARQTARAGGLGCTLKRRRVRMPSVPSDPTKSFVTSMPPWAAMAPPVWPVPAPRGTIGVPVSAAIRIAATTSAVESGTTTTSGRRRIRSDQNDASYAYGSSVAGSTMTRSRGMAARSRSTMASRVWRAMRSRYRRDISIQTAPIVLSSHVRAADLATCISCGLCLNDCPTYRVLGDEADSPRGRIQLIRQLVSTDAAVDDRLSGHLEACLVCRACETACPSGVPFGRIMEAAREDLREREQPRLVARTVRRLGLETVTRQGRLRVATRLLDLYVRSGAQRAVRASRLLPKRLRSMES